MLAGGTLAFTVAWFGDRPELPPYSLHLPEGNSALAAKARKPKAEEYLRPSKPIDPRLMKGLLPVSWSDDRFFPADGSICSCCKGREFWSRGCGWCCSVCHPPVRRDDVLFRSTEAP